MSDHDGRRAPEARHGRRAPGLLLLLLLLSSCGGAGSGADPPEGAPVACALAGAAAFEPVCRAERIVAGDQRLLVIRHPDGSFRRFELGVPMRGIVAADGAEAAVIARRPDLVEVTVGDNRYRLPVAGE